MKKTIFVILIVFLSIVVKGQIATNFSCSDCNGTTIDLFNQLDSSKVIVMCWVMPCGTCVPMAKTTYNVVESFQTTNPGRVFYYLCDDYANTVCASLNGWANNNAIPSSSFSIRISNTAIKMSDYGSTAMPKVVVLGGAAHTVFYNADNTVDPTALVNAINSALVAPSEILSNNIQSSEINLFPNPVTNIMNVSIFIKSSSNVIVEIFNCLGQSVYSKTEFYRSDEIKFGIDTGELQNGVYFLKVSDETGNKTVKFNIAH